MYAAKCFILTYRGWILPPYYTCSGKLKAKLNPDFLITGIFYEKSTKYKKKPHNGDMCTNTNSRKKLIKYTELTTSVTQTLLFLIYREICFLTCTFNFPSYSWCRGNIFIFEKDIFNFHLSLEASKQFDCCSSSRDDSTSSLTKTSSY